MSHSMNTAWKTVSSMSQMTQLLILVIAVVTASLVGCSSSPQATADSNLSQSTLCKVLDAWKAGSQATSLRDQAPPIIVGDHQWDAGYKLVSYSLVGVPHEMGGSVQFNVELRMLNTQLEECEEEGQYMITTSPAITVIRQ